MSERGETGGRRSRPSRATAGRSGAEGTTTRRPRGRRPTGRATPDRARSETAGGLASLGPLNYALLGTALVAIVVGYLLLDRGSITAAPLLLVLGYVVLIPAGLLVGSREPPDSR